MQCNLSAHAMARVRQRGFKEADIALLGRYGTVTRDGVLLRRQDVVSAVSALKREITQLERLAGTYAVMDGDTVLTVYRPSKKRARSQLQ
ncbi:MAG: hypothetical protein QF412_07090 [Planctomycetota bacterium]|jgi:hypothetical protein|nr:hypothetical protein [Planctomycetota bacterium]